MAKRRKSTKSKKTDGGAGILGIIVLAVAFLTPICLLISWLYFRFQEKKQFEYYQPFSNTCDDFWLDSYEKQRYITAYNTHNEERNRQKEIEKIIEEKKISRNKDGSISARSNLGKQLSKDYKRSNEQRKNAINEICSLENNPRIRWDKINKIIRLKIASLYGLGVWSLSFLCFSNQYFKLNSNHANILLFKISAGSLIIAWIIYVFNNKPLSKFSPRPSMVTIDNIDDFSSKKTHIIP